MPNGNPTATTSSPGCRCAVEPSVAACRSSGIFFALDHGQIVFGIRADDFNLGFGAVEKRDRHALGAGDHVQIGQDRPVVDDHHAGADAVHPLARARFVVLVVAAHADHRRHDRSGGLGCARRQRLGFQACATPPRRCRPASVRAPRDCMWSRTTNSAQRDQHAANQQQSSGHGGGKRASAAGPGWTGIGATRNCRRSDRRRRWIVACRLCGAIKRRSFHWEKSSTDG